MSGYFIDIVLIATHLFVFLMRRRAPRPTLFPYTTLFRSQRCREIRERSARCQAAAAMSVFMQVEGLSGVRSECFHPSRSEEHTSELQSRGHLVCRLLLEKKNM